MVTMQIMYGLLTQRNQTKNQQKGQTSCPLAKLKVVEVTFKAMHAGTMSMSHKQNNETSKDLSVNQIHATCW